MSKSGVAPRQLGWSGGTGLLKFDRKHFFLLAFLFVAFSILTSFHFHGFSYPIWRDLIDNSPHQEILLGRAQAIRSDDYLGLTAYLSQEIHDPPFPIVNHLIGNGQNMLLLNVPAKHWVELFRPQTWGGFLGSDFGIAWKWWLNFFGLFYAYFLVFMLISQNRFFISTFASLILLFSPFFQFWSLNGAPVAIFIALSFVFAIYLLYATSNPKIILYSILLGWSATAFIRCLYPPYTISLFYLFIFLMGGFALRGKTQGRVIHKIPIKLLGVFIAVLFIAISFGNYYQAVQEPWNLLRETVYPGQRIALGGGMLLTRLFSNNFILFPQVKDWGYFGNICEAASFLFFFPIVSAMVLWNSFKYRESSDVFSIMILAYLALLLLWVFYGFPASLAKISLLNRVPENRTVIGFGIANLVLIVSYLSFTPAQSVVIRKKFAPLIFAFLWLVFLLFLGFQLQKVFPEIETKEYLLVSFLMGLLGYALINRWESSLVLLAAISIYSTVWFNPLVRGGVSFLRENDLAKKIVELDNQSGKDSVWAVSGSMQLPNLLRAIGVRALNGIHYYPQFELWKKLDGRGEHSSVYNRYAHVLFSVSGKAEEIQFSNPWLDQVNVTFNPLRGDLQKLGVDYLLNVGGDTSLLDQSPGLKQVYSFRDKQIYQVSEDKK